MKAVPDVEDEEEACSVIKKAVALAAENLDGMRAVEGEKLAADLIKRGGMVRELVKEIEKRAPLVAVEYTKSSEHG